MNTTEDIVKRMKMSKLAQQSAGIAFLHARARTSEGYTLGQKRMMRAALRKRLGGFQEADVMRSQGDGELVQHRKTDQNKEDVEEDEDEEYGVRRSVRSWTRGSRAKKREKSTKRPTCRFATGADTA